MKLEQGKQRLGDTVNLYYDGADTTVEQTLVLRSQQQAFDSILEWLEPKGRPCLEHGMATTKLSVREFIESVFESLIRFTLKLVQVLLDEIQPHHTELEILRKSTKQGRLLSVFKLIE